MRSVVYLTSAEDLSLFSRVGIQEVILAVKEFSRRGTLTMSEALKLHSQAQELGIKTLFEWDALMEEPRMRSLVIGLAEQFVFNEIRVRDAGAILWSREHLHCPIQLLLEAGHHNQMSIEAWKLRLGERLSRLIVSPELPLTKLSEWRKNLALPIEILGLGPLLLFHSPRSLLAPLGQAHEDEIIATGASEESPHKGFPLRENVHGTLMFHPKDLGLLERWDDMIRAGIDYVRIDHRHEEPSSIERVVTFISHPTAMMAQRLRESWSREWMRGYFDVNKSDVLFSKLRNQHLEKKPTFKAQVLESKREGWLAVKVTGELLKCGEELVVKNPQGEERPIKIGWLKDENFAQVEELPKDAIGFIPWVAGAPSKSVLTH